MKTYQHTQHGKGIVLGMAIAAVGILIGGFFLRPVLFALPMLALFAWLFHSLTIEIADSELRWRFGPGWIRKRVPLDSMREE